METRAPKREQILADLRAAILDGHLPPGAALPSAHELCTRYTTSRVTVRRALERLLAEGLIDMRQGARATVRQAPLVRIAIVATDWRRHRDAQRPGFNATVAEHGIIGRQEILDVQDGVPAPGRIADALGIDDGTPMVMRFVRMFADEQPVRLNRSWFPAEWASGTALAGRRRIRGSAAGYVEDPAGPIGRRLAFTDVDLEARNTPTSEEQQLLDLARGVSVVNTITTFLDAGEQPVFAQEETADASRHRWRFRIAL